MTGRWKRRTRQELGQVHDLARVLFKPRNGQAWTAEERGFLARELRALAKRWAPGFFLFLLPGGLVLAPLYAALLDVRARAIVRVGGQRPGDPTPAEAIDKASAAPLERVS